MSVQAFNSPSRAIVFRIAINCAAYGLLVHRSLASK